MTKQSVLDQAKTLTKQEQMELAYELWDLLDDKDISLTISPDLAAELDRRIAADDADETPGEPWSVLRERLLRGKL